MVHTSVNGANVIIVDDNGHILVEKSTYGSKKWMLPGGGIERGESAKHAAKSETEEETCLIIEEDDLSLVGYFKQRNPNAQDDGFVFLFECKRVKGTLTQEPNEEVSEARFMSIDEIIERREEFGLGYVRLIVHYFRVTKGFLQMPMEARLSDKVDYINETTHLII